MRRPAISSARIGLAVLLAAAIVVVVVFFPIRIGSPYELQGAFSNAGALRVGSPVRISGVDVGEVTKIAGGAGPVALVTFTVDGGHRRLVRQDATLSIRPRLALEGNDAIDVHLGSPALPPIDAGTRIPLERTAVSVQLDQVLGILDAPTRHALQGSIEGLAHGLGPRGRREASGAADLRNAATELDRALGSAEVVARAARGTRTGDLRTAVRASGDTFSQLSKDPTALDALMRNYNAVSGVLAGREQRVAATVRAAARLAGRAPARLAEIDTALGSVRTFADDVRPALRAAPATLSSATAALTQLQGFVGRPELGGLLRDLRPAAAALPSLVTRLRPLAAQLDEVAGCLGQRVVPTLNMNLPDGRLSAGVPVWQEALHLGGNLASFSNTFDGNGTAVRAGTQLSDTGVTSRLPNGLKVFGGANFSGVAPVSVGDLYAVPKHPEAPCTDQAPVKLGNRRLDGTPPGLTPTRIPAPDRATLALRRAITARDRRGVLAALIRLFPDLHPSSKRRPAPTKHFPSLVERPPAPASAPAPPIATPVPAAVGAVTGPVRKATDGIASVLDRLLGKPEGTRP